MNIRTLPCGTCYACGADGETLYDELPDRLYGVPGEWNFKRCTKHDCGILWLDPKPMLEDIELAYRTYFTHQTPEVSVQIGDKLRRRIMNFVKFGYLSRKYGYSNPTSTAFQNWAGFCIYLDPLRHAELDASVIYLRQRNRGCLLDVGCGTGETLRTMRDLGWAVEGLDTDPVAVQRGQALGLPIQRGSLRECSYPSNQFDAITMFHVIEHLHDPLFDLQQAYRLLKKGGLLVVVTPNVASLGHRFFQRDWIHLDPPRHLHIFGCRPLAALTERAELRVKRAFTTVRWAAYAFAHSMLIRRRGVSSFDVTPPRLLYALARSMALIEWVTLTLQPLLGEEIVLVAQKAH
jgi:SAM-dependent methyltransferase